MNNQTAKAIGSNSNNIANSQKIRVLIVDDQNSVRQRLKLILESEADLEVVGIAKDGAIAIKQVESLRPDVALIDLEMPEMNGVKASKIISKCFPDCRILVLSSHDTNEYINQAMNAGAKGYLLKSTPPEELNNAIRSINKGYSHLSPGLWEKIRQGESQSTSEPTKAEAQEVNYTQSSTQQTKLFEQKSTEPLASSGKLDQLRPVVNLKSWVPLAALSSLIAAAAGFWSVYGKIPVTVEGRGVLIRPTKVVPLQAESTGQLLELKIKPGDEVKKGEVIATMAQSDLRKQLESARAKLVQLRDRDVNLLQTQKSDRDLQSISEQRQILEQRLEILEELTPTLRDKGLVSIERDRQTWETRLKTLRELLPAHEKRLATRKDLLEQGAISNDVLLQAQQEYFDNTAQINEAESQLKQLDVKEAGASKEYRSNLNEIKNIKAQLQELESRTANIAQQERETTTNRTQEIQATQREIEGLTEQIKDNGQIVSQHDGKILEITTNRGQIVQAGTPIANIDIDNPEGKMVGITYFSVEDGKKIQPNMTIQITPQTVKPERFGGIVGKVNKISPFSITKEATASLVGNPEVVEGLVSEDQSGLMQVSASLQEDNTFSGYEWSSSAGPNFKISPETTTTARVKVDERSPISYIIPSLK